MRLTEEQIAVVETEGDQIVSAGSGTGKSSVVLAHATKRPSKKKLILFFNKSMADEMSHRAKKMKLQGADIRTSHSLAFREMGIYGKYEVGSFNAYEVLKTYPKMRYSPENLGQCNIALKLYTKWASSADDTWDETAEYFLKDPVFERMLDLSDKKKVLLIVNHIDEMIKAKKLPMPHFVYLKWFQLQKRKLEYDILYIDEFQDTAPVVLDIFKNQDHMMRVGVGDASQAIYGFNGALDAMKYFPEFPRNYLTQSFRFPQYIADKANEILAWKKHLGPEYFDPKMKIVGIDNPSPNNYKAILARSNSQILGRAIQDVFEFGDYSKIHFEGSFDGYINNGAVSIYDVL